MIPISYLEDVASCRRRGMSVSALAAWFQVPRTRVRYLLRKCAAKNLLVDKSTRYWTKDTEVALLRMAGCSEWQIALRHSIR